jgi:hypothetical protein
MLRNTTFVVVTLLAAGAIPVSAQTPFPLPLPLPQMQGTPEDRAACEPDVHRYCRAALPDTFRILECLKANRAQLSDACRGVLTRYNQ